MYSGGESYKRDRRNYGSTKERGTTGSVIVTGEQKKGGNLRGLKESTEREFLVQDTG